ncbi:proline dipeptidase [Tatumella morbirosei]|uniref:Xaa-Pro dipeptidase n=1 Tax=Tatumella morbirosei TaxID=642227 RepID=A0A095TU88_9GAMM|nr:Xaa-Pro dipeptidase [Tatumella morbirosei]KGD80104.1 proline dipeptidase [Tatumella morbirosei]
MNSLNELYKSHLMTLQQHAQQVLAAGNLEALLIHSGELQNVFLDDHTYPFKVNPQFKAWLPVTQNPNCWLWIDGVSKPKLWFYSPVDYWHKPEQVPESFWTDEFEITELRDKAHIAQLLPTDRSRVAYIGPVTERARQLGIIESHINPQAVIDFLHYYRSFKTDYELFCMREAQKIAVAGHRAARQAFFSGQSEFQINSAYLLATGQRDTDVPYGNIVALNEHASYLHYTQLDFRAPEVSLSFLLDAGAEYNGYAADLTRSYAADVGSDYADLVTRMDQQQQALINTLQAGTNYADYHLQMNQRIASVLCEFDLVTGLSEEALVSENITSVFMPHGVGHPLGLQVHDVAGFMQDDQGTHLAAPSHYPWLRCTRTLAPGMVLTIEPGIYFIDSLLSPWRQGSFSKHFNWQRIDQLRPYGGIRIEDNVVIRDDGIENMTRDLQLA